MTFNKTTITMRKTLALLVPIFSLLFLSSCSNDETVSEQEPVIIDYQEENPLPGYLTATGYNQESTAILNTAQSHEIGFFFKPLKKGKINSIVVKIPVTDSNLTVKIWDLRTNTIIRTETVDVNTANTEITKIITPLELVKNKDYAITMTTQNYFKKNRTDLGMTNHPITIGNIKINGSYFSNSNTQNPPFITLIGLYNGDCSFNFLRTE
jgi:hypothetical protein